MACGFQQWLQFDAQLHHAGSCAIRLSMIKRSLSNFCLSVSVFMVSPDWGKEMHHFTAT